MTTIRSSGRGLTALLPAGLARRLARAFVGLVAVALALNGAISMWLSYEEATASAVGVQREKAAAAAERVAQFVGEIESQIGWTTRAEWSRVSIDQRRYDFIRLLRQSPAITEALFIDGAGKEQLRLSRLEPDSVGGGADLSADPRFSRAVAERTWYGPVYFRRGSEPYMTLSMAHAGRMPGVTSVGVNLKLVWDVIASIRVGEQGYAYVTDAAGKLIAHPDMSLVLRDTDLSQLPQVAQAIASAGGGLSVMQEAVRGPDGRMVLSASAAIPKLGWRVFVELPRREVLAPVLTSLYQTLALIGVGTAVALLLGGWLARRLAGPIQRLEASAQKLGEGDLSQRAPVTSDDEIGRLAERFNIMAGRIQEARETLERKVDERTADLNEALEQQTATADILKVIAASPSDVQPVFDAIVEAALRLTDGANCHMTRLEGEHLHLIALNKTDENRAAALWAHYPLRLADSAARHSWEKGEPAIVTDVENDPRLSEASRTVMRSRGSKSMVVMPMMSKGQFIGTIVVTRKLAEPFGAKKIELLKTFADQAVIAIENTRLFNETKEALEQQTATGNILGVIAASPTDIRPVLQAVAESACEVCDAYDGAVVLRQGDDLLFSAHHGPIPIGLDKWPINRNWTAGRAVIDRVPVHVPDLMAPEAEEFSDGRTFSIKMGHRAIISVPLLREGDAIGAIVLRRRDPQPFTDKQIALLQTFAAQAVIAINNVHLFEEVQTRTRELQESLEFQTATSEVLSVISRSPSTVQPIFDTIVATASRLCRAEQSYLMMYDGEFARPVASSNDASELSKFMAVEPIALNRHTMTGRVALERRTIHLPDCLADPDYAPLAHQQIAGYRTMLGVPLLRDGEAIGSISLLRTVVDPFTDKQIALVETFADQAIIAIENARLFEALQARTAELSQSLDDLRAAQDRLVQTEKLASLGQLTAGIAHEIKNPLNFVNNFSELSIDLVGELEQALARAGSALDPALRDETQEISDLLKSNLAKVVQHGKRADSIVKNMLAHSREGGGERRSIDVNLAVEEALNLAYHGARAERPGFNIGLERDYDGAVGKMDLYPQEFTRVLLNLIGNGFHAADRKLKEGANGGFQPVLKVTTRATTNAVEIAVRDNGTGIPDDVKARIFEPFFTTKPAGEGTGLGLSLSHDIIVKQHGGSLDVVTVPGEFTEFRIKLPRARTVQPKAP